MNSKTSRHRQLQFEERGAKRGAVFRILMSDFITFKRTEVFLGPKLNMVLGPNGTGKSTIMSALCIGLAGNISVLVRNKLSDYVRHGSESGFVEIELFKASSDGKKNVVIRRTFDCKERSKWTMENPAQHGDNGKRQWRQIKEKVVHTLTKSLNIQINNLCVFLAQERVQSFSGLKPQELLDETQKAIDIRLHDDHQDIIKQKKDMQGQEREFEVLKGQLDQLESQMKELEKDVSQVNQRKEYEKQIKHLKQKKPAVEYVNANDKLKEMETNKKKLEDLLSAEQKRQEPVNKEIKKWQAIEKHRIDASQKASKAFSDCEAKRSAFLKRLRKYDDDIDSQEKDLGAVETMHETRLDEQNRLAATISKLNKELAKCEQQDAIKDAHNSDLSTIRKEKEERRSKHYRAKKNLSKFSKLLASNRAKLIADKSNLDRQRLVKCRNFFLSRNRNATDLERVVSVIDNSRDKFEKPVLGPLGREIKTVSSDAANFLELTCKSILDKFLVQTERDRQTLTRIARENKFRLKISLVENSSTNQGLARRPSGNEEAVRHLGGHFLDEALSEDTDETVKYYLKLAKKIHTIVYVTNVNVKVEDIMSRRRGDNLLTTVLTPQNKHEVRFSRYGDQQMWANVSPLHDIRATILSPETPAELTELQGQIEDLQSQVSQAEAEVASLDKHMHELVLRERGIENIKKGIQTEERKRRELEGRLRKQNKDFEKLQAPDENVEAKKQKIHKQLVTLCTKRCKDAEAFDDVCSKLPKLILEKIGAALNLKQAEGVLGSWILILQRLEEENDEKKALVEEEKRKCDEQETVVEGLKTVYKKLKRKLTKQDKEAIQELPQQTIDEIDTRISELEIQVSSISVEESAEERYSQLQREKTGIEERYKTQESKIAQYQQSINRLFTKWKPKLEDKIAKVNIMFKDHFQSAGFRGSVTLVLDEDDLNRCGIEIKVSYRDNAPLEILSEKQSGGERVVATMVYLLCLQNVTDCPFRGVDEINQGMDEINERMIFDLIVKSSTGDAPQYFLVTPTLLPRLKFSPDITFLIIYRGPWLKHRDHPGEAWDNAEFTETANQARPFIEFGDEDEEAESAPKRRRKTGNLLS